MNLENELKLYRTKQASVLKVPCYCVMLDEAIKNIATRKPTTMQSLRNIRGMGPTRCKKYGDDIIRMVNQSKVPPAQPVRVKHSPTHMIPPQLLHTKRPISAPPPNRAPFRGIEPNDSEDVYVLELAGGRVYVGKSRDVGHRISQHMANTGAAFTREYKPTGNILPRLGNVRGDGDAAERDETLRYMFLRGIDMVRGWKYTTVHLSKADINDAESNIRELFNLCRRCGNGAHFMTACKFKFDRLGRPIAENNNKTTI